MFEVVLENLPEGVHHATVQAWYFEEGDSVTKGDEIAELTTEAGTFTVAAPETGVLAEVYYDEGETVDLGEVLCLIEDEDADLEDEDEEEDTE